MATPEESLFTEEWVKKMIDAAIAAEWQRIADQIMNVPLPVEISCQQFKPNDPPWREVPRPGFAEFRRNLANAIMKGNV